MKCFSMFLMGLSLLALHSSCSEQGSSQYKSQRPGDLGFQDLLNRGKSPVRLDNTDKSSSLNLYGSGLQSSLSLSNIDNRGRYSSHLQFDTKSMFDIELSSDTITSYIESFMSQNSNLLQVSFGELVPAENFIQKLSNNLTVATYNRVFNGLPVDNARIQFYFYDVNDSLVLARVNNHTYGPILEIKGTPELSDQVDFDYLTGISGLNKVDSKNLIYAVKEGENYSFHYGTRVKVSNADNSETFTILMDNDQETMVEAFSNKVHAAHTLEVEHYERSYIFNDAKTVPFALVGVDNIATNELGVFDTEATTAQITLASPTSASGVVESGANAFFSFPVALQGNKTLVKPDNTNIAAINTYMSIHRVSEFVGQFLTPNQAPILSTGIQANINIADVCNAFFDGQTINFFQQGDLDANTTCSNTSLISDIVYHEWGHALDFQVGTVTGQITDGAFSEGIGDILSALITDSSNLAPGFFLNNNTGIRQLRNEATVPSVSNEVHIEGQIIGGAFWDLKKMMDAKYGLEEGTRKTAELFFQHLRVTDVYTDSYRNILLLNDDDANPATPSPDYCLINKAFARHNVSDTDLAEGLDCVDEDELLRFNIAAESSDKLTLNISAMGAEKIIVCSNASDASECDLDDPQNIVFEKTEIDEYIGNRLFYNTQAEIIPSATSSILLITTDIYDNIITQKAISFGQRDRSNDLSNRLAN